MPAAPRGASRVQAKPKGGPAKRPKTAAPQAGPSLSPRIVLAAAAGVLVLAGAVALGTGGRGERLVAAVGHGIDARFGEAGFRVRQVHVEGASEMASADIVKAAGVKEGQPMLGLDLAQLRGKVEQVGWVKQARVVRLLPDTLVISVDQRRQLAVWQFEGRTRVIDDHGVVIPEADPNAFATLPLVVGAGAAAHAGEILPLVAQRPRLMERLEALVRVDDRRWDIRLKDGSLIQLPSAAEEEALGELEKLDVRSRILDLGFERVDLRNPDTVAVRPRPQSAPTAPEPVSEGA